MSTWGERGTEALNNYDSIMKFDKVIGDVAPAQHIDIAIF
jgi:hypothetical protein